MKKKNMVKNYINIEKIKKAMIDKHSIVDDECILRDLIKSKTDVPAKDIEKMTDSILYLIENYSHFTKQIENEIVKDVKEMLCNKRLNSDDMLSILSDNNILINDDGCLSYKRDIVNDLEKETDNTYHTFLAIPCTSSLQKHLFIEFKLLTKRELESLLEDITDTCVDIVTDIDIQITDIYIN